VSLSVDDNLFLVGVENCGYSTRLEARVKKFSAILRFFTQFGFIVFTDLSIISY